jgi:hypothetical protein
MGIGRSVNDSEIYAACLSVPGVRAVRDLIVSVPVTSGGSASTLRTHSLPWQIIIRRPELQRALKRGRTIVQLPNPGTDPTLCIGGHRHDPFAGGFFALAPEDLDLTPMPDDTTRPDD